MNTVSEEMSASVDVYEDGVMTGSVQVSAEERKQPVSQVNLHVKFGSWIKSIIMVCILYVIDDCDKTELIHCNVKWT